MNTAHTDDDLERLLREIVVGNKTSGEQLCNLLRPGVQFLVSWYGYRSDRIDIVNLVLAGIFAAVVKGSVHSAPGLLSCTRAKVREVGGAAPERRAARNNGAAEADAMRRFIESIPPQDYAVLRRYYVLGHGEDQILADTGFSRSRFHDLKHDARESFRRQRPAAPAASA